MEELYRRADRYSMLEENVRAATQTVMITSQSTKGNKLPGKKPSGSKEGQNRDRRKRFGDQPLKKKELPQFTPLNFSYERLLPIIRNLIEFKWPAPIQMDLSQSNKSLRCNYNRDHGHETDRCRSLKLLVEKLIKAGHLRRYITKPEHIVESGQAADIITACAAVLLEPRLAINYILGGPSNDQYQSKCQQRKLLRVATVKARVNVIHTKCDTPIPRVLLTTRQPAETYKYRVSQYHTHFLHI